MIKKTARWYTYILMAAAGLLIGRGLQGLWWDYPLRALLWDQAIMEPLVAFWGYDWSDWVTNPSVEKSIQQLVRGCAIYLLLCAALLLPSLRKRPIARWLLSGAGVLVIGLVLLGTKEQFWRFGYLLEHALQMGAVFLAINVAAQGVLGTLRPWIRLLTAATFIGHGLYAIGYYPIPYHFVLMTTEGLDFIFGASNHAGSADFTGAGLSPEAARFILLIVGGLDFLAAICLLLPSKKAQQLGLYWIIPWAILTTLARLWANGQYSSWENLLFLWTPEFLFRLPHIFLPLALWKEGGASTR
ncbi:MAG: hypothetical protein AAFQ37_07785 [Bacteroidota bacterium]